MRVTTKAMIVAAAVSATLSSATAQAPQAPVDIIIQQGFSELIDIPGEFQDVAIGDPSIVDAQPITANTLLVNGIEQGTTNMIVIDDAGRALYRARVHVRPVRIWPGYGVKVIHGTGLRANYSCNREAGCEVVKFEQVFGPAPVIQNFAPGGVNAGAVAGGSQAAPAPAAPASE